MILSTHLVNSKMISHFLGPASDSEFQTRNPRVANTGCLSKLQPIKANPIQTNDAHIQSQPPTIHTPHEKRRQRNNSNNKNENKKTPDPKKCHPNWQKKSLVYLKKKHMVRNYLQLHPWKMNKNNPIRKKKRTIDSNSGSPDLTLDGGPRHNELLPSLNPGASFLSNGDTKNPDMNHESSLVQVPGSGW